MTIAGTGFVADPCVPTNDSIVADSSSSSGPLFPDPPPLPHAVSAAHSTAADITPKIRFIAHPALSVDAPEFFRAAHWPPKIQEAILS